MFPVLLTQSVGFILPIRLAKLYSRNKAYLFKFFCWNGRSYLYVLIFLIMLAELQSNSREKKSGHILFLALIFLFRDIFESVISIYAAEFSAATVFSAAAPNFRLVNGSSKLTTIFLYRARRRWILVCIARTTPQGCIGDHLHCANRDGYFFSV
jgi:hypothetical protein